MLGCAMNELSGRETYNLAKQLYQSNSTADIQSALSHIDPDLPREEWVRTLMALKAELGEGGRDLALRWSSGGQSYNERDFCDTWRSCRTDGGVTVGSLFYMAQNNGFKSRKNSYQNKSQPKPPMGTQGVNLFRKEESPTPKGVKRQGVAPLHGRHPWMSSMYDIH